MFKPGTLVDVQADEHADEDMQATVTAPKDMPPEIAEAFKWLEQAQSHLLRGNYKATVELACDAVNAIALAKGIHGYATY